MCGKSIGVMLVLLSSSLPRLMAAEWTHPLKNGERECWVVKYHEDYQHPGAGANAFKALQCQVVWPANPPAPPARIPVTLRISKYERVQKLDPNDERTWYYLATSWTGGNRPEDYVLTVTGHVDNLLDNPRGNGKKQKRPLHVDAAGDYMVGGDKHTVNIYGVVFSNRTHSGGGNKKDYWRVDLRLTDRTVPKNPGEGEATSGDVEQAGPCQGGAGRKTTKPVDSDPCDGPVSDDIMEESAYYPPQEEPGATPDYSLPYDGAW